MLVGFRRIVCTKYRFSRRIRLEILKSYNDKITVNHLKVNKQATPMPSSKVIASERQFCYTSEDFHWPSGNQKSQIELSNFDKELQQTWDAAADAGYFTYKLDKVEGRLARGKYSLYIQLNELRFTKRRKPDPMNSVCQPFNPEKFNFTKVQSKEVLFELCPKHRTASGTSSNDHHLMIINVSPMEYGHSLLAPSVNSCLPQVLTEDAILLALETSMLSNHSKEDGVVSKFPRELTELFQGFRVGFNSLCAFCSVNHLHFHVWYNKFPSYLETAAVIPICEDVFEVRDYATTAFVFELGPQTDANLLARKIHQVSSYFINSEVAHTCLIMRGDRCSSKGLKNGFVHNENEHSVLRVFLWPRVAVTGSEVKSSYAGLDERPMAVCEFGGFVAVETRETYDSFTEEQFCEHMRRATLPEEEFLKHREAVEELLNK